GSTVLGVNFVNNTAVLQPGITLVSAGAGTSSTAFSLSPAQTTRGLITYGLAFNGANNSFNLAGAPSATAIRLLKAPEGAETLWNDSADAVSAQLASQRDATWAGAPANGGRLWLQTFGHVATRKQTRTDTVYGITQTVGSNYQQDAFGAQAGLGFLSSGALAAGITGGYANSVLKFPGFDQKITYDAFNAGLYAGYNLGGLFLNALGKYDFYRVHMNSVSAGLNTRSNGRSYGVKGEAGFRFGATGFYAEPNVSIAFVRTELDGIRPLGVAIDFDHMTGTRGSAGLRLGNALPIGGDSIASFYVAGDYVHEFQGTQGLVFSSGSNAVPYRNVPLQDFGRGKLGVTIKSGAVTGFIEGDGIVSKNYTGGGGRAGLRVAF
ncbi:autotransporter domain-containing protein, partial [Sphingomonas sp. 10B4]